MNIAMSKIGVASVLLPLGVILAVAYYTFANGFNGSKGMNLRGHDGCLYIDQHSGSITKWLKKPRTKVEVAYVVGLPSNLFEEDVWVWTLANHCIGSSNKDTVTISSLNVSSDGFFLEFEEGRSKGPIRSIAAQIEEYRIISGHRPDKGQK